MLGALATLGGAVAGNFIKGGISSYFGNKAADTEYNMNRRLQKHNFEFQREMRDTQYQATIEDMKKAGINPAVALSGGASLSQAAGGSTASVGVPAPDTGSMEGIMGAIQQTALTQAQKENITADTELKEKQSGKTDSEIKLNHQRVEIDKALADAEIAMKTATTQKEKATAEQTYQLALNQKIKNMYEAMYGREMPDGALDWVFSRVYGKAMQIGGSSTGLEPIINELIEQYGKKK